MPGGVGAKTHDWLVGHVCHACHHELDQGHWRKDYRVRMYVLCATLERLFADGVLMVK